MFDLEQEAFGLQFPPRHVSLPGRQERASVNFRSVGNRFNRRWCNGGGEGIIPSARTARRKGRAPDRTSGNH